MAEPLLHLASSSPRRRQILDSLGLPHSWAAVDVDETPASGEPALALARRLARDKARAGRMQHRGARVILGADTVVTLDGETFGKAASAAEGLDMLSRLSGRVHTVITAVVLSLPDVELAAESSSEVRLSTIDADDALAYWQSGEPAGKAGAYAIQGLGGIFVQSVSGSYSGVVGLPVFETARLLMQAGVDVLRCGGQAT